MIFRYAHNYPHLKAELIAQGLSVLRRSVNSNLRPVVKFILIALPVMTLLVGSGRTGQLPLAYMSIAKAQAADFSANDNSEALSSSYLTKHFDANDEQSLLKFTQKEVAALFGKPSFAREDATARVWQYKTSGCVVDFYFYEEGAAPGDNPISYVDMRLKEELLPGSPSRTTPISEQEKSRCLSDVVATKNSSSRIHA